MQKKNELFFSFPRRSNFGVSQSYEKTSAEHLEPLDKGRL